ncbi:restriction endonuclease subunit S [Henriciella barbarensis]|uniref:Restriction endonuclease subunit S n=1 Tax=Henriciella barbarensis TaxID=86342 RepID=A0A399R5D8_9PROT|nr:restriction endonuclease subunit S [Henriciella barbarensis]RIJ26123.1 restriction endonuclease subunit S [Henriciella barbarensis]
MNDAVNSPSFVRAGEGSEPWVEVSLGDLADLKNGYAFASSTYNVLGQYRIVTIANVQQGRMDLRQCSRIVSAPKDLQSHQLLSHGDILISMTGNVGRVCLVNEDNCLLNQRVGKLSPRRVSRSFLFQLLLQPTFVEAMAGKATGGAQGNLGKDDILDHPFYVPTCRSEQEAIAEVLSDADALIEGLDRLIAKKRLIKQGAMQDLLTAKRRLPGFSGEWGERRLRTLCKVSRGASPRPIASARWFDNSSSTGWVRISDLPQSGRFLTQTTQRLSQDGIDRSRRVPIGSLIMSIAATVGKPAITTIDTCIHDGFVVFSDLKVDQLFLYYLLKTMEPEWSQHGQTGSQMNINTAIIEAAEVFVPETIEEQAAISCVFADMDTEIQALETRLDKARQVKEGMMQNLLTGRIRLV